MLEPGVAETDDKAQTGHRFAAPACPDGHAGLRVLLLVAFGLAFLLGGRSRGRSGSRRGLGRILFGFDARVAGDDDGKLIGGVRADDVLALLAEQRRVPEVG